MSLDKIQTELMQYAKKEIKQFNIKKHILPEHANPIGRGGVSCSYCNGNDHNIYECMLDIDLVKILSSEERPNFNIMSIHILKKIATQIDVKPTQGKAHLVLKMNQYWTKNRNKRETELKALRQEIGLLKINRMIEECPICFENMEEMNSSSIRCGHKFCTDCFVMSMMTQNSCPMCRAPVFKTRI
jgi:hypothetical protein